MKIKGIAINADASRLDGSLEMLRGELDYYARLGFSHVELAPHGAGVMYNGNLHRDRVEELLAVLSEYAFQYTVHGPNPSNLMNLDQLTDERRMFTASLAFTRAIGADVMVYHAGRYLPEEKFLLPDRDILTPEKKRVMWETERTLLKEMGDTAAKHGIVIAVENARPYLDASPYCYGEFLNMMSTMMQEVSHPNVGVTLDLGHAYLAARHHGYNLLDGIDSVSPYIRHIHMHDNYGRSCASYEKKQSEMTAAGRGDLHMPIGWGEIPAKDILSRIKNYHGVITLEMRPRYRPYFAEALDNARKLLDIQAQPEPARVIAFNDAPPVS